MARKNLSPEQLSDHWGGVPLSTLNRWRWTGTGPEFMKLGKHIVYRVRDVEEFEEQKVRRDTTCGGFTTCVEEGKRITKGAQL